MRLRLCLALFLLLLLNVAPQARAWVTFQTTLSSGYYQDINEEKRLPVFFYWNLNHTASNDIETSIDLGVNNNLVVPKWKFFLYQAFSTIPLSKGFALAPHRRTRIQIGRQFLTEGFELGLLDGAQVPIYFSQDSGLWLVAGALSPLEDMKIDFSSSRIYGGSIHGTWLGLKLKSGYFNKLQEGHQAHLAHLSAAKTVTDIPWRPSAIVKGQLDLRGPFFDQALGELTLTPHDNLAFTGTYLTRQPNRFNAESGNLLYRFFSASNQESFGVASAWRLNSPLGATFRSSLTIDGKIQWITYTASSRTEQAQQEELSLNFSRLGYAWVPSITHLKSYGGTALQFGLRHQRPLGDHSDLRAEIGIARISKINGIFGWGYHTRGGLGFRLGSRLLALALLELERNPVFEFDTRVVAYVSHFFY